MNDFRVRHLKGESPLLIRYNEVVGVTVGTSVREGGVENTFHACLI